MRSFWARLRTARFRLAAILGTVAALSFAIVAIAGHPEVSLPGSNFEIDTDANLRVDDAAPSIDWANVTEVRKQDTTSGPTDESFGQGSKEDTPVPSVVDGSIPPNKSDLKFFGIYQEGTSSSGFLNLFWSRVQDPSGTTNMDFELNKRQCTPNASPADPDCSGNGITPLRSTGDLLIQYDLSQGGVNPVLSVSEWVTSGSSAQCQASNSIPCWSTRTDLTASGDATGSINTSAIPLAESDGLGGQSARTFGEAQIKLSAILDPTTCDSFGSAYLKSRSSDSFTAAMKDFVPPAPISITNCGKVEITKTDDDGNALSGAEFTLYTDAAPLDGVAPHGAEDTATTLKCTTGTDGKCTINAVPFGQYWVVETVTPAGFNTAADQNVIVSSGSATASVTFVNVEQKGNVKIHKEDDAGNVLAGVKFTLKGTSDLGDAVDEECTTDSSGECTFSNIPLGTYTLDEDASTLPAGYSKDPSLPNSVTIDDDGETVTVTLENPRTHRVIVLVCHEGTDTLYAVKIDGGTEKTSIGAVPAGLAAKTVTEKDLCDLGGASFGGLPHGDKALTAKIASH